MAHPHHLPKNQAADSTPHEWLYVPSVGSYTWDVWSPHPMGPAAASCPTGCARAFRRAMPGFQRLSLPDRGWFWEEPGLPWFAQVTRPEVVLTAAQMVLRGLGPSSGARPGGARAKEHLGLTLGAKTPYGGCSLKSTRRGQSGGGGGEKRTDGGNGEGRKAGKPGEKEQEG